jgi:hypothetical protein
MPDKFDPYREALVMETSTIWPEEYEDLDSRKKEKIAAAVHADPENAAHLSYVRTHSGFCREITITDEDLARLRKK